MLVPSSQRVFHLSFSHSVWSQGWACLYADRLRGSPDSLWDFSGVLKENEVSFDELLAIVPINTAKMPKAFKILAGSRPGATHITFVELVFNFTRSSARYTHHHHQSRKLKKPKKGMIPQVSAYAWPTEHRQGHLSRQFIHLQMIPWHSYLPVRSLPRGRDEAVGIVLVSSASSWPLSSQRALLPLLVPWPKAHPLHEQDTGQHWEVIDATYRLISGVQTLSKLWYCFLLKAFDYLVCSYLNTFVIMALPGNRTRQRRTSLHNYQVHLPKSLMGRKSWSFDLHSAKADTFLFWE